MRTVGLMGTLVLLIPFFCFAQSDEENRTHFYEEFGWTIAMPEGFEIVDSAEWAQMQDRGAKVVKNATGEEIIDRPNYIFVFRNTRFNYFEANARLFDEAVDGDYRETFRNVNEVFYYTFQTQVPGAKLDSASSVETIDNVEFLRYKMSIEVPGRKITWIMYGRLFGQHDLTVNIMYVEEREGKKMLNALRASRFN